MVGEKIKREISIYKNTTEKEEMNQINANEKYGEEHIKNKNIRHKE